ncbi:MAG: hypothetical protein J6386_17370 [Candidatus Synoicihabitans palmerolidicus]|nr:hypothetical protein [Candidatus Synoicihabitans palmerolidicus]
MADPSTRKQVSFGLIWITAISYFTGRMAGIPLFTLAFWQMHGLQVILIMASAPLLMLLGHTVWVFWLFGRDQAKSTLHTVALWWRRWSGRGAMSSGHNTPLAVVRRCPLLRPIPASARKLLAERLTPFRLGPWKMLSDIGVPIPRISIIVSGQVGVYRESATGNLELMQVLNEN